jgi:hypothetical protein
MILIAMRTLLFDEKSIIKFIMPANMGILLPKFVYSLTIADYFLAALGAPWHPRLPRRPAGRQILRH